MPRRRLGRTDLKVGPLCLGTMTCGEQNAQRQVHAQLDRALEAGINFIDSAAMYPVPPIAETQGCTEAYIGRWRAAATTASSWRPRSQVRPTDQCGLMG